MTEATFTFRVDDELKTQFANAAKAQDRTGAQLLRDFMRDYVRREADAASHESWFRDQVEAGRGAANDGKVVSAEEVEAEAAAWREETRRTLANSTR